MHHGLNLFFLASHDCSSQLPPIPLVADRPRFSRYRTFSLFAFKSVAQRQGIECCQNQSLGAILAKLVDLSLSDYAKSLSRKVSTNHCLWVKYVLDFPRPRIFLDTEL